MNTPDIIGTALFLSAASACGGFCIWNWRAATADEATLRSVRLWSAAQRAEQAAEDNSTPPGDREPAPQIDTAPPVRLATVTSITTRRAA